MRKCALQETRRKTSPMQIGRTPGAAGGGRTSSGRAAAAARSAVPETAGVQSLRCTATGPDAAGVQSLRCTASETALGPESAGDSWGPCCCEASRSPRCAAMRADRRA